MALAIPRILYAAAGSLTYGGSLHRLMVGSIYAGSALVVGTSLCSCNGVRLLCSGEGEVEVELYYVDPGVLARLDRELVSYDARRVSLPVRFRGGLPGILAEAHIVPKSVCSEEASEKPYRRLLLAVPPLVPPPAQPLALYPAVLEDVEPTEDGRAFTESPGAHWEAGVADVYVHRSVVEEWVESLGSRLCHVKAKTGSGLAVYPLAPLRVEGG